MRRLIEIGALLVISAAACWVSGCTDDTTCGPGTVLEAGECVPLQAANCAGDGVRFVNGICVPDYDEVCGPGTELNDDGTHCVATEPTTAADTGTTVTDTGVDTGIDAGIDVGADGGLDVADAGDVTEETTEDTGAVFPNCDDDLVAGQKVCVYGQVLNFLDMAAAPSDADPQLLVQVKNLIEAQTAAGAGEIADALATASLLPGGYYVLPGFDLGSSEVKTSIAIVGEEDAEEGPGTVWMRTIGGLLADFGSGTTEFELPLFTVPLSAIAGWNALLSLTGDNALNKAGFVLVRVVDTELNPLSGAVVTVSSCGGSAEVEHFAGNAYGDLTGTATDSTGVALIRGTVGAGTECQCTATRAGMITGVPATCASSPERLTVGAIVMVSGS